MKLTLDRSSALAALSRVAGGVSKKPQMPILAHVLLTARDGALQITATDLDMQITDIAQAHVHSPGQATVSAATFGDLLRNLPDGSDAELQLMPNGQLSVRAVRAKFSLPTLPPADFPLMAIDGEQSEIELPASALRRLLTVTRMAVGNEAVRFFLNGAYFHAGEMPDGSPSLRVVTTDGLRMVVVDMPAPENAETLSPSIVPARALDTMLKLAGDTDHPVTVRLTGTRVVMISGETQFVSKLLDGTYPPYDRVIPASCPIVVPVDRDLLTGAIKRVAVMAGDKSRSLALELSSGKLAISARDVDMGSAGEEIEVEFHGEALHMGLNARHAIEALDGVSGETVEIHIQNAVSPVMLRDSKDAARLFILVPLRGGAS
ncbi:MAG: DNA polymerase III subunit beta [Caulobacteraceae bacterium]